MFQAMGIGGRRSSRQRRIPVPAAGYDVRAADRPQEIGDALRLVLLIAIDGNGDIVPSGDGLSKPGDQRLALTSVDITTDDPHTRMLGGEPGGPFGRAIVAHAEVALRCSPPAFPQPALERGLFGLGRARA